MSDHNSKIIEAYKSKDFAKLKEILGFDIIALHKDRCDGYKNSQILEKYNVGINTMLKYLKILGLYNSKHGRNQHGGNNLIKDKDWLSEKLQKHSTNEIAEELGIHPSTVSKYVAKYKLIPNAQSWAASKYHSDKNPNIDKLTKEFLESEYKTKTARQIGLENWVSDGTVLNRLKRHGIVVRENGRHQSKCSDEALDLLKNKEWLHNRYLTNTAQEIADSINCTQRLVLIYLKRHGIDAKSSYSYQSVRKPSKPQLRLVELLRKKYDNVIEGHILNNGQRTYEIDIYVPDIKTFIEVQGIHWHGLESRHWAYRRVRSKMWYDLFKFQYVLSEFPDHSLKYVREDQIESFFLVKSSEVTENFDKKSYDFIIGDKNCKEFISSNHYLGSCSGHILYSMVKGSEIVAAASFGNVIRQNITNDNAIELKRLVSVDKSKNLLSYFLSRCIKDLKRFGFSKITTYADISPVRKGEHSGSIYKATNFRYVGLTQPSYFYWSETSGCLHKKTVYNRAIKEGMNEKQYYTSIGLFKLPEWPKHKFEYFLR